MIPNGSVFNELRLNRELCDAEIRVDGVEFVIHKIILCNCSQYFRALFRWSPPQRRVFDILNVSSEMMRIIIDSAYTGIVPVTSENVRELSVAALQFIVEDVIKACGDFMEGMMEPVNCIGIWQFADYYYYPQVRDKAFLFALSHFEEVAATEQFLSLSAQELVQLMERDKLIVTKEDKVFEAALRWVAHAPEERRGHLPQLLSNVRLAFTGKEYFRKTVAKNALVRANQECRLIVCDAVDTMLEMRARRNSFSMCGNPLARPRLPSAILLAVGGWNTGGPTNAIEAYDVHADSWVVVHETEDELRAYHGTAYLDGFMYCIGGYESNYCFCTVSRFDLVTRRWQQVAPMHWRRKYVSVTVMDGFIYAVGGYDRRHRLDCAERFLPSANQWTVIGRMNERRSAAGCTSFRGKVYVCGGFNGQECVSTAECYNPETDQWTLIAEMSTRRSGIGVIAYADCIFAVGGFNGTSRLKTVEAYNPVTNTWRDVAPMQIPRSNFGIELIDDRLFVVGGFNGVCATSQVESYDVRTDVWSDVHKMIVSRSAVSCCVVSGFPNLAEYASPRPPLHEEAT